MAEVKGTALNKIPKGSMGLTHVLVLVLASALCVSGQTFGEVVASTCDVRVLREAALSAMRQSVCDPAFDNNLVSIEGLRPNLQLLPDTESSLMIPMLQSAASDSLGLVLDSSNQTLLVRQCLNSVVDSFALWQWSNSQQCGNRAKRSFPLRPKDASFENGVWIEVADATFWVSFMAQHDWRFVKFSSDGFAIFEYSPLPATLVDVVFRQVASFQRWSNAQSTRGITVNVNGLFDALTQSQLVAMPITGPEMWPLTFCKSESADENNATTMAQRAAVFEPPVPDRLVEDDDALALIIIVPLAVVVALLSAILSIVFFSSGPKVPLGSKQGDSDARREIPQEILQYMSLPELNQERVDSWDDFDLGDPGIWTEYPSEFDTTELEEEIKRMRKDPKYKSAKKRTFGGDKDGHSAPISPRSQLERPTSVSNDSDDDEGEAVVDATVVFPPPSNRATQKEVSLDEAPASATAQAPVRGDSSLSYEDEEEYTSYSASSATMHRTAIAAAPIAQPPSANGEEDSYEEEEEYSYYTSSLSTRGGAAAVVATTTRTAQPGSDDSEERSYDEDEFEVSSFTE